MRIALIMICVVALGAGGWYLHHGEAPPVEYRTAKVQRGDIVSTITATGTLEPEEVIDVGAQVAGLIQSFGTDASGKTIDYRSPVEPDMVLARIDDAVYKADLDTAAAQLAQAKVNVAKSKADLATANAKFFQAEQNWNRAKAMVPSDALSQNDYEMYRAEYEIGKANVDVATAQIAQAQAGIAQAQATLNKAQRNLDFCTIRSPVKGVIIDRRVNIGQTVVSSFDAPSLFLIAKDLTRMQIWVAVNEADVGRIVPGAPVTFTCDAFADKSFKGKVGKVRLNATMAQNVVLYTVEVDAANPDNVLLPYLTTNVQFQVDKESDVLQVPNAALRWYPSSADEVAPDARASWKPIEEPKSAGAKPAKQGAPHKKKTEERHGTVWVKQGALVRPVEVKLGLSDGMNTAVTADNLKEEDEVVLGEKLQTGGDTKSNPFAPPARRR